MASSYPTRTPGPLGGLEDRIARLELGVRQVTSPTAEQYAQAVENLTNWSAVSQDLDSSFSWPSAQTWVQLIEIPIALDTGRPVHTLFTGQAVFDSIPKDTTAWVQIAFYYPDGSYGFGHGTAYVSTGGQTVLTAAPAGLYWNGLFDGLGYAFLRVALSTQPSGTVTPSDSNSAQLVGLVGV